MNPKNLSESEAFKELVKQHALKEMRVRKAVRLNAAEVKMETFDFGQEVGVMLGGSFACLEGLSRFRCDFCLDDEAKGVRSFLRRLLSRITRNSRNPVRTLVLEFEAGLVYPEANFDTLEEDGFLVLGDPVPTIKMVSERIETL